MLPGRLDRLVVLEARDRPSAQARLARARRGPGVDALPLASSRRRASASSRPPSPAPPGSSRWPRPAGPRAWCGRRPGSKPGAAWPSRRRRSWARAIPACRGTPGVGDDVPQGVPGLQRLGPGRAREAADLLAQEPGHARRLDAHQHGAAVEEDLVEAADQDQGPAARIERARTRPAATPAAWIQRPIVDREGASLRPQEGQQDADLGRGSAPSPRPWRRTPAALAAGNSMARVEPVPELGRSRGGGPGSLPDQLLAGRAVGRLGPTDGVEDLAGMIVDGLTAAADVTGLAGDGATRPR